MKLCATWTLGPESPTTGLAKAIPKLEQTVSQVSDLDSRMSSFEFCSSSPAFFTGHQGRAGIEIGMGSRQLAHAAFAARDQSKSAGIISA